MEGGRVGIRPGSENYFTLTRRRPTIIFNYAHTSLTAEKKCSATAQRNLDDASLAKGKHPEGDGAIICSGNTIP